MAEADRRRPERMDRDLDLDSFYRSPERDQPRTERRADGVDDRGFARGAPDDAVRRPPNLDLDSFYRSPGDARHYDWEEHAASARMAESPRSAEEILSAEPAHDWQEPRKATIAAPADDHLQEYASRDYPINDYKIMDSPVAPELPIAAIIPAQPQISAAPVPDEEPLPAYQPVVVPEAVPASTVEDRLARLRENPIFRYAAIGGLMGIVFAAALISFSWVVSNPSTPYDLGGANSPGAGLKGHLFVKWEDKKLQYRVSIEPGDPDQKPGFALALTNPPHPVSVTLQLKDAKGFVLCTNDVLLKYDPDRAPALPAQFPLPGDNGAISRTGGSADQGLVQNAADEAAREKGKDLFQNQAGPDGQIEAITAQGTMPCPEDSYEKTSLWSFATNFPSLAEQGQLLKDQREAQANAGRTPVRKKPAAKPVPPVLSFAIEGDDELVGYDPAGVLETATGSSFYLDKQAGPQSLTGWLTFPAQIHYRCDQTSACIVTHAGTGAMLRARLKK
jgi:hypothetical protein